MRKVTSYKCPECGMSYKTLSGWGDHVRRLHPEIVPKGWSDARFFYYTLTGKSEGSCIQCHQPTEWNEATGKYSRYCNNPKCKQEYCKMAKQRMIDKYGKPHLLDDPDKQREMLKAKKNSGEYKFSTGGKVGYVCSYERDFLMTCDIVLGLKATDIISPSPHNYVYMYEGKPHIYIPDFYIPDFNLEIEIKDGGDNPNMHHKIQEVDKVKEKLKDQVMIANPSVNYFKVVNKKYDDFYDFILNCKNAIDDDKLKQIQSKITAIQQPAVEGISLFEARKDALKQAANFNIAFNIVAGPMLDREIELAFGKYKDYSALSHSYSYPYYFYRGTPKFIDPAYKNTEDLILEIPLIVVNTHTPFRYRDDREFDSNKIIDVLHTFERNLNNTIKLHNLYKKYPNVSAPYVQWEGSDWKLEVTMHYSIDPANESVDYDENDIANESAFINHKDEYFNIDQWKRSTGHNILYIAGLSGSGKSTLGRDISKKYNATYIELDRIASDWWYEDERFNPNGYQGNVTALLKEIFKDEDPREEFKTPIDRSVMRKRRYSKLYEYCLKHPDQLFIFEGVQVAGYFDIDFLVDKPVIVKNTSRNTSFKRMSIRDREIWTNRENYLGMKADYKADDHNLDSLRKLMRENASPSPALESVDKDIMFETPQELQSWMKANISYAEFTKLMSPEEVMTKKRGSCHDQAMFAYSCLKKMGYKPKLLFFITYANGNPVGDMTHTLCYYEESNKIYWIENAWDGAKGIRAYPSVNALKNDIWQRYKKMPNFKKYPEIEFSDISPKTPGMKLDEYVSSALESAPALESGPIVVKTGNPGWIIEKRMLTQDFKNIPDNSVLHHTRDTYLERLAKDPSSMRNLEYYGFYNRKLNELTGILSIASDGRSKCIDLIVVDDIYRNHGIGTYMLNSAVVNHGASWLIVKTTNDPAISIYEKYPNYHNNACHLMVLGSPANESVGSDASYYGLPEDKKYPMDDPKHVLLAIKFFNYVDEDKEELLASRINSRIAEFKIHNINVGEKNRFAKYYTPVEEEVVVDWAPNVPYMTVANEGTDPSVQLLDDDFAYAPIKLDRDLYEKYKGTDYYPLYIILMKNISPLGSVIRAYTKEEYSHSAISFDASMDDIYTFGNSVIKKPLGRQRSFGASHESFRKNSFKFSYSGKTEYSLYVMFFKKDEIDRIKKKVDEIFLHHDEYKYNVEGLISYIFNRPKTDPKKLFCSQFVALVINSGRNGILNKDPSLYSPVGLTTIRGICHVETGHIEDYDQYRAEKKTRAVFDSLIENHAYEALEHANIMYNA